MKRNQHRYQGMTPWRDKDWLYNEYVTKDRSTREIADEFGCKQNTIQCWLKKHGIKKTIVKRVRMNAPRYFDKEYLYKQHIINHKSLTEIARDEGVSEDTIRYHAEQNGIQTWRTRTPITLRDDKLDIIKNLYLDCCLSTVDIAKIFQTTSSNVRVFLKKHNVDRRTLQEAHLVKRATPVDERFYNKEWLYDMHCVQRITSKEIGVLLGLDGGTVRRQMQRFGITTMTNSESKIGRMCGAKHPNWQGGRTPLKALLREYFHIHQAPVIMLRDDYTCQLCGAQHTALHVHHIVPFAQIVDTIIDEHPDLNPDDPIDRLSLYVLIVADKRFTDINNLVTYCKNCHLYCVHNYNSKTISSQASIEEGSTTIPQGSTSQAVGDGSARKL